MIEKAKGIDDPPIIMDRRNEPEIIAADIKDYDLASAAYHDRVGGRVSGAHFLNIYP